MVGSIIGGAGQQTPPSKAFQPNQAPQNPSDTPKVKDAPQPIKAQETSVSSGNEAEISQKLALSRDTVLPDPNRVSSSVNRGSVLDISV